MHVNPQTRGLFLTPGLEAILPNAASTATAVENAYWRDPEAYVNGLTGSVRTLEGFGGENGEGVKYSLFYGPGSDRAAEITAVFAPLNDCPPQANAADFLAYLQDPNPDDKETAQPNSFRRAMKTANLHAANIAEGHGRPVIVFYGPIKSSMFDREDREAIASGNTEPYGRVLRQGLKQAQAEIHGADGETQFTGVDIYSPGMGHIGAGAARSLMLFEEGPEVTSLTLPNLITNVNVPLHRPEAVLKFADRAKLLARYSVRQYYREPGVEDLTELAEIPETCVSAESDKAGSEKAMRGRQFGAMFDFSTLAAMMRSGYVTQSVERLLAAGVAVTIPLAYNAKITEGTERAFGEGHPGLEIIDIHSGVKDEYAGLMTNESDRLDYSLALRGTQRALSR